MNFVRCFAKASLVSTVLVLAASLLMLGCSGSAQPSTLISVLEGIVITADVGAPVVASLSPQAAGWVGLVPGAITALLDIIEGTTPIAAATAAVTQLQSVWAQGQNLLPNLPATDKAVIGGILGAIQAGINLYQKQYPPTATVTTGGISGDAIIAMYSHGFVDSSNASTAKVKPAKLSKADKASIARIRKHMSSITSATAARKGK